MKQGALSAIAILSITALSPAMRADPIDDCAKQYMARHRVPGAAVAVVKDGQVETLRAYGMANLETETPMTTDSVFEIASLTKPMTASAVMLLIQEGRIKVDDPVSNYIHGAPQTWQGITVRHLTQPAWRRS